LGSFKPWVLKKPATNPNDGNWVSMPELPCPCRAPLWVSTLGQSSLDVPGATWLVEVLWVMGLNPKHALANIAWDSTPMGLVGTKSAK
jgi:hypothetical protein